MVFKAVGSVLESWEKLQQWGEKSREKKKKMLNKKRIEKKKIYSALKKEKKKSLTKKDLTEGCE